MADTPTRPDVPLAVLVIGVLLVILLAAIILQWILGVVIGLVRLVIFLAVMAGLAWVGFRLISGASSR